MITRFRDPARQLPRVIGIAFTVTSLIYLALATATIAVLGTGADSLVPLADLLRVAIGATGPIVAAIAAAALTLAATNAYISGAAALVTELRTVREPRRPARSSLLQLGIAAAGLPLLGGYATGIVTTAQLVALPTTLFLTVYLGCTAAAVRTLTGPVRLAAAVSCVAVLSVLAFSGWALLVALAVVLISVIPRRQHRPNQRPQYVSPSGR